MSKELHGKNILVTGATEGIGKAAALEMARRGARLTIVGRNREKTARVLEAVRAAGAADADSILGDLSVLADIRAVARAYRERADRLDVLVNNAGAVFTSYATTPDGFERTFALNHLGYFLLTRELRPLLAASQGARVVSTSSLAHRMGRIELDEIARRERRKDAGFRPYGDSKLANILFTRELSRRLAPQGGVANCFHPGYVATGFALNNGDLLSKVQALVGPLVARTPEKGAETLVWLAASEAGGRASGEYFSDKKVSSTSKAARDDGLAAALWALSERLCGEA